MLNQTSRYTTVVAIPLAQVIPTEAIIFAILTQASTLSVVGRVSATFFNVLED
jgi:hypothetical protein